MTEPGGGVFTLQATDAYKTLTRQQVMDQSIEVVRRRIDELGTREPDIARAGDDRILVQVPGLQDPTQLKTILGKTAKMTFQLVDEQANPHGPGGARSATRSCRSKARTRICRLSWWSAGCWCQATG